MKPSILGSINAVFSKDVEHNNKELAMLETGYLIHEDSISHLEIVAVNHQGVRTVLKIHDFNVKLEEMFDENGIPVE
ncbi:hypothetical protein [Heyndrickxia camelliae]|uniref:Uncharacterized protein n=1 Tax=Heyndrickxia camelliae TaxID=1707093 RepID=A0A2N3LDD7_9BACI|nr:hypothetical protein [Heyndrickxia camelliae]PKR82606.1 hypothetical protein CWO92_23530 [Heyndrickxia camelliae]